MCRVRYTTLLSVYFLMLDTNMQASPDHPIKDHIPNSTWLFVGDVTITANEQIIIIIEKMMMMYFKLILFIINNLNN
jgi:hypothetical protein